MGGRRGGKLGAESWELGASKQAVWQGACRDGSEACREHAGGICRCETRGVLESGKRMHASARYDLHLGMACTDDGKLAPRRCTSGGVHGGNYGWLLPLKPPGNQLRSGRSTDRVKQLLVLLPILLITGFRLRRRVARVKVARLQPLSSTPASTSRCIPAQPQDDRKTTQGVPGRHTIRHGGGSGGISPCVLLRAY